MTDEIIIDGVDVSECEYINCCDKKTKCIILQDDICADSQYCKGCNCYYKQLKRLEFELKVTKADYEASEQENKELKEVKEQLKKWNDENLKRQDDMQLWIDLAEEQRRKYRSALEEINLILDELKQQYDYMTDYSEIKEIQNKINECLGG